MPTEALDETPGPSSAITNNLIPNNVEAHPAANKPAPRVSNLIHNSTSNIVPSPSVTKVPKNKQPFGGFSFESESLPDFSEFEGSSGSEAQDTLGDGVKKRKAGEERRESEAEPKMAPVTTIETVTISRPLKVIAFICGLFACILLIMGLASSEWLVSSGYRQGLFVYCVTNTTNGSNPKVPFVPDAEQGTDRTTFGCHRIDLNIQAYTLVAAGFVVISLLVNAFATLMTVLGLRCRDPNMKYKYYKIAVYVMAVALIAILVSLVVYPVCFAQIMSQSDRIYWEFGWAYGVGWGASIFLFGGIILLLCDKESEEIYYKERTIVQYADTENKT